MTRLNNIVQMILGFKRVFNYSFLPIYFHKCNFEDSSLLACSYFKKSSCDLKEQNPSFTTTTTTFTTFTILWFLEMSISRQQ